MNRKTRFYRLGFVLNGVVFFLGADLFFNSAKDGFGFISLAAALVNFFCALQYRATRSGWMNIIVNVMNLLVAVTITWDYFTSGKEYIQYAWVFVSIMYLVVTAVQIVDFYKRRQAA